MDTTKFIWMDGEFVPWDEAKIHVLTHTLHYGGGVFEGIRFYETDNGPAIFRLPEHIDRLYYSAESIEMDVSYSKETIIDATMELIVKNEIPSGYIRHLIFYGYGKMGLNPTGAPVNFSIACWPWGKYLAKDMINIKISKYIRIHPKSTIGDAKICGHYVNSILASLEIHKEGYDEALFLDYKGNVAEGPGENIFMVKEGKIYTPPPGSILPGITRNSVMTIASDLGYEVHEKPITPVELIQADECFFTGTAAEVSGIAKIDETEIADGKMGEITKKIAETYLNAVKGKEEKYKKWLTYVR